MKVWAYLYRVSLLVSLIGVLASGNVSGQTAASPLKLYMDENGRLKQQKAALTEENLTLKQALLAEKQRSAQLQASLDQVEPGIAERDRQIGDLKAELAIANSKVVERGRLASLLAWSLVLFASGLYVYSKRIVVQQQLLKFMEWGIAHINVNGRHRPQQPARLTKRVSENSIPPEELSERLYGQGRRRA